MKWNKMVNQSSLRTHPQISYMAWISTIAMLRILSSQTGSPMKRLKMISV